VKHRAPTALKPEFIEEKEGFGPTYSLGEFTVNLADPGRYLRVNIVLELGSKSEELKEEVTKTRDYQIRDLIVVILSSERMESLATPKGKEMLKRKIVDNINRILKYGKIKNVYFPEFVMQ
jgi:flagellar FliL protein